jgi:CheY-like chemotaxis protein
LEDSRAILVVEDDPLVQRVVAVIFSGGGFAIAIASSDEQALELLGAADGKYRAVQPTRNRAGVFRG